MADESASSSHEGTEIVVHWLERSRSQRLLWLLEECNLLYEIKAYKRVDGHAPAEMKDVHPLGKSPILTIKPPGQTEPVAMAESGAIFEYLVAHYASHLAPRCYEDGQQGKVCGETESWLRYHYYMHYSEGSFMSLLMRIHTLHKAEGANVSSVEAGLKRDVKTHLAFLESQINSAPEDWRYFCGRNLTAADILMCFPLLVVQSSMGGLADYPGLEAYVERMITRPAYKKSIEKAEHASGEKYGLV